MEPVIECGIADCDHMATEAVLYRPSPVQVLDGAWSVNMMCGQGTHRAASATREIKTFDSGATLLVLTSPDGFREGTFALSRIGEL